MQDDNDIRIKRQWETSPFRRNAPVIDPERECDAFSKTFCDAFCDEFCGEFYEEYHRSNRTDERHADAIEGIGDNHGSIPADAGVEDGNIEDSVNIVDFNSDRLEACRALCARISLKVCRRAYWDVIGRGPTA